MRKQISLALGWTLVGLLWNGSLALAAAQPGLSVANATGAKGSTVTVSIGYTSDDPASIVAMDFNLTYNKDQVTPDPSKLQNLLTAPFNDKVQASITQPGVVKILVQPVVQNPLPILPTTNPMITIPFAINANATPGDVALTITPTDATLGNAKAVAVTPSITNGKITISSIVPGDADGNGKIDLLDVMTVVSVYLSSSVAAGVPDCDSNGKIDLMDIMCVVTKYLSQ